MTPASELYRLEADIPTRTDLFGLAWREPDFGHAGVSIVRKSDGKIVAIISDDSYGGQNWKAQLEVDLEAMTAFDFEQAWGVNIYR